MMIYFLHNLSVLKQTQQVIKLITVLIHKQKERETDMKTKRQEIVRRGEKDNERETNRDIKRQRDRQCQRDKQTDINK